MATLQFRRLLRRFLFVHADDALDTKRSVRTPETAESIENNGFAFTYSLTGGFSLGGGWSDEPKKFPKNERLVEELML